MTVVKRTTTYVKSKPYESIAIVGFSIGVLYLLTRSGEKGAAPGTPGQSVFEKVTEKITSGIADSASNTLSGIARVPADVVFGTGEQLVKKSEVSVSKEVFGDQKRENVSAFMATGTKKGDIFAKPVNYEEFISYQPPVFRVAAASGNIITGNRAAQWGSFAANETKKGLAAQGVSERRLQEQYTHQSAYGQALTSLGQAVTTPFGGGGAMGWGASLTNWWNR